MPTLKGSKTEHNLLAAFAGESQAHVDRDALIFSTCLLILSAKPKN